MKDFLTKLLKAIVDNPGDVTVAETTDQGVTTLEIAVSPSDMGKVIGRQGRIIRALRDLVRILAVKQNRRVNVVLREE